MPARRILLATLVTLGTLPLFGASCDKKSVADTTPVASPVVLAAPAGAGAGSKPPVAPVLPGIDSTALGVAARARLAQLGDKLASPCGKAHSLRKSLETDAACKRAPFAGRYVVRLLALDLTDEEIGAAYGARYASTAPLTIPVDAAAYEGQPRATVRIVEFFDYGCPHCRLVLPVLEELVRRYAGDVVVYFKHYPLGGRAESVQAAMAALSAQRQGKFRELHKRMLDGQDDLSRPALLRYARAARLDEQQTARDLDDPRLRERVLADKADGERAGLEGTPTLFVNGRLYTDPNTPELLADWIDEELAVNR